MPTYTVTTPEGCLTNEKRAAIAREITRVHSETTGAPTQPSSGARRTRQGLIFIQFLSRLAPRMPAHDPEKCEAVFRKDHAQNNKLSYVSLTVPA